MRKNPTQEAGEHLMTILHDTQHTKDRKDLTNMVFITGNSGSGKDTQAKKLITWWEEQKIGNKKNFVSIATGDLFREAKENYPDAFLVQRSSEISLTKRQPSLMPLIMSAQKLFEIKKHPRQLVVINGSPRSVDELGYWAQLIADGCLPLAHIIAIDVPEDECIRRLMERGRSDSNTEELAREKTEWFNDVKLVYDVMISYQFVQNFIKLHRVDGTGTEEEVSGRICDLITKLGMLDYQ